jgi:Glycosyl hydrolase family 12
MANHRKPRRRVPLVGVAALSMLAGATVGGIVLSGGGGAPRAATLDSAWVTSAMVDSFARAVPAAAGQNVLVYACLSSGKLTGVSVNAPECPANSIRLHWVAQSGPTSSSSPLASPSSSPSPSTASPSPSARRTRKPGPSATPSPSSSPTSSSSPLPSPSSSSPAPSAPPTTAPPASSPPPATPTGQTNCTTNQNGGANNNVTQLDDDTYHLQANEYNSGSTFTICTNGNPDFTIQSSGVNVTHDGAPGAYPSIYKGCHWGYCTQNSDMPVPVSSMISTPDKVTTTYDTSTVSSGAWDDSYDIWYNPARSTNNNSSGLEMMIWLNHFGGVQPAGSPGPTVNIDGISFTAWYGGSGNGGTVSFVANNPVSSVNNMDLGPLAAYAVSKGYMQNSWFLIDVEAGFEPWTSGQGLTADAFNVTVH